MRSQQHSEWHTSRCARRTLATATPEGFEPRLRQLLDRLQFWRDADPDELPSTRGDKASDVLARDGPLGVFKWWRRNEQSAREAAHDAVQQLQDAGTAMRAGDLKSAVENLSEMGVQLLPAPPGASADGESPLAIMERCATFIIASLTPWDFDRREPALTFVTSWMDELRAAPGAPDIGPLVRFTSTIKPLHSEWKLSARTKLLELGHGGVLIGKAGVFLAGDAPAYVGLEADRVIALPRLSHTKLFANTNYRSSRKPFATPVVASVGVQQTLVFAKRLELTLRVGLSTRHADRPLFFSPMAHSTYF